MNQLQQPEIGKVSRTTLLLSQLQVPVRYFISDSLTDDERYTVLKNLSKDRNVPAEINENLHNTLDIFVKTCKKYRVRSECCLSRKEKKDFVFYQLFFNKEQHLIRFFEDISWPTDTIEWPPYTIH